MFIFHKTEIQTVILRCLTIISLNCYKSYDIKHKNAKNAKKATHVFVQNCKMKINGNICVLCHNFWSNQNVDLLSTSKWLSESQFCERWAYIWQKNGQKWLYKGHIYIKGHSFPYRLYLYFLELGGKSKESLRRTWYSAIILL